MPDIRHLLQIHAPPAMVFPLVSTAKGFSHWWTADVREVIAPQPGVELRLPGSTVYRLRAETFLPPSQAAWTCETGQEWTGTQLLFLLQPHAAGTTLRFEHNDWGAETDYYLSCNTAWGELLFRLRAEAEGRGPGPLFLRDELGP